MHKCTKLLISFPWTFRLQCILSKWSLKPTDILCHVLGEMFTDFYSCYWYDFFVFDKEKKTVNFIASNWILNQPWNWSTLNVLRFVDIVGWLVSWRIALVSLSGSFSYKICVVFNQLYWLIECLVGIFFPDVWVCHTDDVNRYAV